jgi:GNAT superfamily N-acetyltransferase
MGQIEKLMKYKKTLDACFPKPPKNTFDVVYKKMQKTPFRVVSYRHSFALLRKLSDGIYVIDWVVVSPKYQNKGIGTKLINKIHSNYRGLFLVNTKDSTRFWLSLGYTIMKKGRNTHLYYLNKTVW